MTLICAAAALILRFVSYSIEWAFLPHEWDLLGQSGTVYDILLMIFACGAALVTIGWLPRFSKP